MQCSSPLVFVITCGENLSNLSAQKLDQKTVRETPMPITRRLFTAFATIAALSAAPVLAHDSGAEHDMHKLAIQVSDNNPGTMTKVLNVTANAAKAFQEEGIPYEIEVVAYNAGLHLFRSDTSPVLDRVKGFTASVPDVTFSACGNTIAGMTKKEGAEPPLIDSARVVPAGVIRLMELADQGYSVIRP